MYIEELHVLKFAFNKQYELRSLTIAYRTNYPKNCCSYSCKSMCKKWRCIYGLCQQFINSKVFLRNTYIHCKYYIYSVCAIDFISPCIVVFMGCVYIITNYMFSDLKAISAFIAYLSTIFYAPAIRRMVEGH